MAVGEKLTYSAKLGMLTLGIGTLEVAGIDTVRGVESLPVPVPAEGQDASFYSLDDVLESWVGTADLISRRFVQDFVENEQAEAPARTRSIPDSGFFREAGPGTRR